MSADLLIIFIGFAGFCLAAYIAHKKQRKTEHFMCPLRGSCTEVIHSDYSKFFGIPVEHIGLCYYAGISIGHGLNLWLFLNSPTFLSVGLFVASTLAFLFSIYLTLIQLFALKKICTWCLLSASFCLVIFLLSFYTIPELTQPLLSWKSI